MKAEIHNPETRQFRTFVRDGVSKPFVCFDLHDGEESSITLFFRSTESIDGLLATLEVARRELVEAQDAPTKTVGHKTVKVGNVSIAVATVR